MSFFNAIFNTPLVSQQGNTYTISFRGMRIIMDMADRTLRTTRLTKNIFSYLTYEKATFPMFFALEVKFMLTKVIEAKQSGEIKDNRVSIAQINSIINTLVQNTWLRDIEHPPSAGVLKTPIPDLASGYTPYPYQSTFYMKYSATVPQYSLTGTILGARPGTGKTITSLLVYKGLPHDYDLIVVCPKNTVYRVWDTTITEQFDVHPHVVDRDGIDILSKGKLPTGQQIFVIHEDALKHIGLLIKFILGKQQRIFLIVDECHGYNDPKSDRTTHLLSAITMMRGKFLALPMSGTPLKALGREAYLVLSLCDPKFTGAARAAFLKIYVASNEAGLAILAHRLGILTFILSTDAGYNKEPVVLVHNITLNNSHRYLLSNVAEEMRSYMEQRRQYYAGQMTTMFALYKKCTDMYRASLTDPKDISEFVSYTQYVMHMNKNGFDRRTMAEISAFCKHVEKTKIIPFLPAGMRAEFRKAVGVIKYVNLVAQGEALGNIFGRRRIECFEDLVRAADIPKLISSAKKKTLCFSDYVPVIMTMAAEAERGGYTPQLVYAETNSKLPAIMEKFQTDPAINPMVATFDSLSTGVPVTAANSIIMANLPYRDADYQQAVARCNRDGQDETVVVHQLMLDTGNEPNLAWRAEFIRQWCKEQVDAMLAESQVITGLLDRPNDIDKLALPKTARMISDMYIKDLL